MVNDAAIWTDQLEPGERSVLDQGLPETLERRPDVLVVGGGILGVSAAAAFAWGCYVQVRKYRRGQPDPAPAVDLGRRLLAMAATVLSHRTVARRDARAGRAHRARATSGAHPRPPRLSERPPRQEYRAT